jgi:hypothetical protein
MSLKEATRLSGPIMLQINASIAFMILDRIDPEPS